MNKKILIAFITCFLVGFFIGLFIINANGKTMQTTTDLNMRQSMSTDAEIVKVIPGGAIVEVECNVIVNDKKWAKVEYDSCNGYCVASYLQKTEVEETETGGKMVLLGRWHITAYTHTGYNCANGNYPTAGYTIAHNSLPFGTKVYIEGLGYRTVEDRGPAYLGTTWADVFMDTYNECIQFGSQYLNVYYIKN